MSNNLRSRVEILIDANTARFESGIAKADRLATQSSENMKRGFERVASGAKQTETQIDKFSSTLVRHEVEVSNVAKSYAGLKNVGIGVIGGLSIGKVIDIADGYGQMAAQIENATNGQREYKLVQDHILQTANTTYRSLKEAQQVFLDVGGALKDYGDSTERALRITDSLSFSFTHNSTAVDKAASATDAFMKSIYSGKVSNEQWISILSAIPSIVGDLSTSLDKSKEEILTLGNAGKLTADHLKDAFDLSREKSEELANTMRNSLADGKVAFANSFEKLVGEANITYDATHRLAGGISFVADNLQTIVEVGGVAVAFWVGTYLPAIVSSTLAGYAKTKQLAEQSVVQYAAIQAERAAAATELAGAQAQVVNTQSTLAALQAERALEIQRMKSQISAQGLAASHTRLAQVGVIEAQVKAELVIANNALAASEARVAAAQNATMITGRGLAGVLFGPVGLGIAVASVAAGYLMMRDSTGNATDAMDIQTGTVEDLVVKYRELDELQRRTTLRELEKEVVDVTNAYTSSYSALSSYVEWLENSGSVSEKTARQMAELIKQYSQGNITAVDFSTAVNQLSGVQDKHKAKVDDLTSAHRKSKDEYDRVKKIQAALITQTQEAINANNAEAQSIDAKRIAQQKLNTEQQSVHDKIKQQLLREEYVLRNMKDMGWSRERAEYSADIRNDAKMGYTGGALPEDLAKMANKGWELNQAAQARIKAEQEVSKQLKDQEKTTQRLVGLVGSTGRSTGNHLHMQYPKGSGKGGVTAADMARFKLGGQTIKPNMSNSPYGKMRGGNPHGGWDFAAPAGTEVTTNVAIKDVTKYQSKNGGYTSRVTFADGVVIDLMHQIPAMMSKVKGGSSAGSSKSSDDAFKAYQDQKKADDDYLKEQQRIREQYYSSWEKLEQEHNEKIQDIQDAFAHDTTTKDMLLQLESERNAKAIEDWIQYEDQRLKEELQANQEIIDARNQFFADMNSAIGDVVGIGINANAKATLSDEEYARWDLNNQHQSGYSNLDDSLSQAQQAINANELLAEQDRYTQLELVYQQYLESKKSLGDQYAKEEQELATSQHVAQLQVWGSLTSQAQNTWSQMTQAVKDANGEQSASFKTMFAMQQAFSIASAIISTEESAAKALTMGPIMGIPMSTLIRGMGYANVAMIAAQTVAGFSDGGYTGAGGKYDLAGIVHRGEVVWSQDDIARWGGVANVESMRKSSDRSLSINRESGLSKALANQTTSGPTINVYTLPGETADVSTNPDGSLDIHIRKLAEETFVNNMANPNSRGSKAMQQNYNVTRKK